MKFSELIREGAAKTDQLRDGNLAGVYQGKVCACAIGAAATAKQSGFPFWSDNQQMEMIETNFPEIVYGHPTSKDMEGIPYLSDSHRWTFYAAIGRMNDEGVLTREEIADWLKKIGR